MDGGSTPTQVFYPVRDPNATTLPLTLPSNPCISVAIIGGNTSIRKQCWAAITSMTLDEVPAYPYAKSGVFSTIHYEEYQSLCIIMERTGAATSVDAAEHHHVLEYQFQNQIKMYSYLFTTCHHVFWCERPSLATLKSLKILQLLNRQLNSVVPKQHTSTFHPGIPPPSVSLKSRLHFFFPLVLGFRGQSTSKLSQSTASTLLTTLTKMKVPAKEAPLFQCEKSSLIFFCSDAEAVATYLQSACSTTFNTILSTPGARPLYSSHWLKLAIGLQSSFGASAYLSMLKRVMDPDFKYSSQLCSEAMVAAREAYTRTGADATTHEAKVERAVAVLHTLACGPALPKYTRKLQAELRSPSAAGERKRVICPSLSVTAQHCTLFAGHEGPHSCPPVETACSCGRTVSSRAPPFLGDTVDVESDWLRSECCLQALECNVGTWGPDAPKIAHHPLSDTSWSILRVGAASSSHDLSKLPGLYSETKTTLFSSKVTLPFMSSKRIIVPAVPSGTLSIAEKPVLYFGFEYECSVGHRWFLDKDMYTRVMRLNKESLNRSSVAELLLKSSEIPIFTWCACSRSSRTPSHEKKLAQLRRIHIMTPNSSALLSLNPHVEWDLSGKDADDKPKHSGSMMFSLPSTVVLPSKSYIVCRLPYTYIVDGKPLFQSSPRAPYDVFLRRFIAL